MNISSVRAIAIDVGFQQQSLQTNRIASPMSRWPDFASNRASWMWPEKKTFVCVEDHEGRKGWGCTNGGEVTELIVNAHLSRLLVNKSTDDISEIWDLMFRSLLHVDKSGFGMMAISAVDIALWDLRARQEGKSLVDLLGGPQSDSIPVYATTSDPYGQSAKGWWGLKAAMPYAPDDGAEGMDFNVKHMETLRDAFGAEGRIMLDAFMSWDVDYTERFFTRSRELDIYWVEDPLPPYDTDGYVQLRQRLDPTVRIALGNFCFNRWDCKQLLDLGVVDILQPDVAWAGGITECLRILEIAEAADVPVFFHNSCEQPWAIALAVAKQRSPVIEFVDRGETSELYSLMSERPKIQDGYLTLSELPPSNIPSLKEVIALGDG